MGRSTVIISLLLIIPIHAQMINIRGTVTRKTSNKPIDSAIVALPSQKLIAITDNQGSFSITGSILAVKPYPDLEQIKERIIFNNMTLTLSLAKPSFVKIDLFDMKGNLLGSVADKTASAGDYRFDMRNFPNAARMTILRVSAGEHVSYFRYFSLKNGSVVKLSSFSTPLKKGPKLAMIEKVVDSIIVSAPNFFTRVIPVTSYDTTLTVSLDTSTLDRFSFFVTSLKALQDLSGSEKGFGGDLRFGKTGPGAGLLGADSICQCIAERSMPGSRVKQWRAFLSVHKGPDGQPVHARDRIGQGPWYDRTGRLVSYTLNDLLQNRPNAHPEIKNDLPNEDGIPNHTPDPTKPAVDNHLTVTGSDSLGRLYTGPTNNFGMGGWIGGRFDTSGSQTATDTVNSTCDDWTTNTSVSGSKPRAGVSWPAQFLWGGGGGRTGDSTRAGSFTGGMMSGMTSWISVWNLSGCEPGIDLETRTGAGLPNVYTIGNGGGYGGFYCFALNP